MASSGRRDSSGDLGGFTTMMDDDEGSVIDDDGSDTISVQGF